MMWGFGAWGAIWMFAFWAGVILLIIWGVRQAPFNATPVDRNRPREILEDRYARGEIDREEFQARRADLERS